MPIKSVLSGEGKFPVKIWTEDIEEEAKAQLDLLSTMPFLYHHVAVMPDVHAGKGSTVGTVIATKGAIIPSTVGADLGCGMMAVKTPYKADQLKDLLPTIRHSIERSIPVGPNSNNKMTPSAAVAWNKLEVLLKDGIRAGGFTDYSPANLDKVALQLGSLGSGNHFIEVCLDVQDCVWIVLHSGSRNIGKVLGGFIVDNAIKACKNWSIKLPSPDLAYLPVEDKHGKEALFYFDWAQKYASANRVEMMSRAMKDLAYTIEKKKEFAPEVTINCHHNYVSVENHFGENVLVTRKGAIRARKNDMGIIPGSMGAETYIVEGLESSDSFHSASHGAGRRMSRTKAKATFTLLDLEKQTAGIECRKDGGVLDEIPSAYKSISQVMENQNDLVKPIYKLHQVMCIKG